uniref:Uncharacterized protein n=1 Tax=Ditylenchus dipsaci TaxID=166011 RepID=A0A915D9R1_9BILA
MCSLVRWQYPSPPELSFYGKRNVELVINLYFTNQKDVLQLFIGGGRCVSMLNNSETTTTATIKPKKKVLRSFELV